MELDTGLHESDQEDEEQEASDHLSFFKHSTDFLADDAHSWYLLDRPHTQDWFEHFERSQNSELRSINL